MTKNFIITRFIFFNFLVLVFTYNYVNAESFGESTGYKLPRYVSLKSDESNLRVGANKDYPILLTYKIENFPIEIINEYKQWREVQDVDGNHGWMHESLFQGDRHGIIKSHYDETTQIYKKPKGSLIWKIGNRNIVKINKCLKIWCHISFNGKKGWINKVNLWGIYKDEEFNIPFYQAIINLYWKFL